MRVLIQRVSEASVKIDQAITAQIGQGLLVFVGIEEADTTEDINWLAAKILNLRIMNDTKGVMNLSVLETGAEVLLVSQFTLHASTNKGNRPSYIKAARPETAIPIYEKFIRELSDLSGKPIKTGTFGADMKVSLINDGPVTIWMDSKRREG